MTHFNGPPGYGPRNQYGYMAQPGPNNAYGQAGYNPMPPFAPPNPAPFSMTQPGFNSFNMPQQAWGANLPQAMLPGMVPAPLPNYAFGSLSINPPSKAVSKPYGQNVVDLANNPFGQENGTLNHQPGANGLNGQPEPAMKSVETGQAHSTSPLQFGKSSFLNFSSTCRTFTYSP
jgi:hypothetical protein